MNQLKQKNTGTEDVVRKTIYLNGTNALIISTTLALSLATATAEGQESTFNSDINDFNESGQVLRHYLDSNSEIETETNKQPTELELLNRYNRISESDWFQETYHGKSVGQITGLEI